VVDVVSFTVQASSPGAQRAPCSPLPPPPGVLGYHGVMSMRRHASAGGPRPDFLDGAAPRRARQPPPGAAALALARCGMAGARVCGAVPWQAHAAGAAAQWTSILFSSEITAAGSTASPSQR